MKAEDISKDAQALLWGGAAVLALGAIAYIWIRGPGGVAKDAGSAAGQVVGGAVVGGVKGISEGLGIPDTNQSQCDQAIAAGNKWDASLYCPASRFLSWILGGSGSAGSAPPVDPTTQLLNDAQSNTGLEYGA